MVALRSNKRMDPPTKKEKKRKLGGSPVALLTGVRSYNPHSRCCSVGCPTPAISCLGASLTPAVGAWGSPSSSRRQRNLHITRLELSTSPSGKGKRSRAQGVPDPDASFRAHND